MVARVIQGVVSEGKMDEVVRLFEEVLVPRAKEREGLEDVLLLTHQGSGQAIAISLWATREAMEYDPQDLDAQLEVVLPLLDEAPSTRTFHVAARA